MKDFLLKLIEWRTWLPIALAILLGYGIYKGLIVYTDLMDWVTQIIAKIKISVDL